MRSRSLIIELEKKRHLDSPDTLNRIIRASIPFIAKRWSKKRLDHEDKWDGVDADERFKIQGSY